MSTYEGELGLLPASDDRHKARYPLTAATVPTTPTPCVIGVRWHRSFDAPQEMRDGHRTIYVVGHGDLGSVRGGHCVCLPPAGFRDPTGWRAYYDQGTEGACVGFGVSRMLSHFNRKRYDAFDIYHRAQIIDEYPNTTAGTSLRAGLDVVREEGPKRVWRTHTYAPDPAEGIIENRWAMDIVDVLAVLGWTPSTTLVPFLNSWNGRCPHVTHMPVEVLDRLLFQEGGECAVVTDRPQDEP